jgi:glucose/arabinose dehydrogenase
VRRFIASGLVVATGLFAAGCAIGSDDDRQADAPAATGQATRQRTSATAPAAGRRTGEPAARGVRLRLLGRFQSPTYLAAPPGDGKRRFVVEREGRIRVVRGGRVLRTPFLDISGLVDTNGEGGLLSMAFAPDYARSRRVYVYYTDNDGFPHIDVLMRSKGSPDRALPSSRRLVIRVEHHRGNHKGGQVQFGPDGMLYAAFGDGGGGGDPDRNGQDLGEILGKMIRIDPKPGGGYSIPADNPFRRRAGARPEIYAYGLRNPFRFSFDRTTGSLTIGDVGQDAVEEIDFIPDRRASGRAPAGGYNFGWSVFEGRSRYNGGSAPGHVPPVIAHSQDAGYCSIIGGYVVRDRSLRGLYGRYVYGDLCKPGLRKAFLKRPNAPNKPLGVRVPSLVSFGEDARGHVYAISLDGPVYRLAPR